MNRVHIYRFSEKLLKTRWRTLEKYAFLPKLEWLTG
jgi:hypothetical protein